MLFQYRYLGQTSVESTASAVGMSFVPDTLRKPVHFSGLLGRHLAFREAISALNGVVVSDLRFKPKDNTLYKEWLKTQEEELLSEAMAQVAGLSERVGPLREELQRMNKERTTVLAPYQAAKMKYFEHLYKIDKEAWFVLDPVITVHPDELFFECFSQDESSYGRLSCNYNVFKELNDFSCGTTNVDYSQGLYDEFQKIRDYKQTRLDVDPGGFTVQTTREDAFHEVKIDLPDSWVRGFLQVSSAMTLPGHTFDLHPLDMQNFCFVLRQQKEQRGPRSIRFQLKNGELVRAIFEPWNHEIVCPRSIYHGADAEIRMWGRRRLLILERLLSVTRRFQVTLLGTGMPSFFLADMGNMTFTLGLSGWTANDWSRLGNFDLMAPRGQVDDATKRRVFEALQENWVESAPSLAARLGLSAATVASALSAWCQAGRAIYDLKGHVYRVREPSREPLPMEALRFANEREARAHQLLAKNPIKRVSSSFTAEGTLEITAKIQDRKLHDVTITIDADERLSGRCTCNFYLQNKLFQGPCEHMIALRLDQQR